jgi:hypothetical protein
MIVKTGYAAIDMSEVQAVHLSADNVLKVVFYTQILETQYDSRDLARRDAFKIIDAMEAK